MLATRGNTSVNATISSRGDHRPCEPEGGLFAAGPQLALGEAADQLAGAPHLAEGADRADLPPEAQARVRPVGGVSADGLCLHGPPLLGRYDPPPRRRARGYPFAPSRLATTWRTA